MQECAVWNANPKLYSESLKLLVLACLARSAKLPTGLYILLALIFFTLSKVISGFIGPISRSFHQMKGICVNFLDLDLFFIHLGMLPLQPIWGKFCEMTFIQHAGISQRIRISQFRFTGDKEHYFATFCAILVKIGPIIPKTSQGVVCAAC